MATVRVNGIDLHVSRFRSGADGRRPQVVGIHGLGVVDSASMGMTLGMPLAKANDVLLYDLRGHGRSELVTSGFTAADHVSDFVALLDALDIDEPVHVLGGSYGSAIAICVAVEHPDRVASLSLVDPQFPMPGWGETLAKILEHYGEMLWSDDPVEAIMTAFGTTARRRAAMLAERGRRLLKETSILDELRSEESLTMEQYASITCPVLAVFGEDSEIYFLQHILRGLIKSTEIVSVPANHIMSFHHPTTRTAIAGFVERVAAERAS